MVVEWYAEQDKSLGVFEDIDDRVSPEEHLGDEPAFRDCCSLLALARHLRPDLLHVLHDHVHVPVESLDLPQQLLVVAQSYQHLVVCLYRFSQQRKWAHVEIIFLHLRLLLHLLYNNINPSCPQRDRHRSDQIKAQPIVEITKKDMISVQLLGSVLLLICSHQDLVQALLGLLVVVGQHRQVQPRHCHLPSQTVLASLRIEALLSRHSLLLLHIHQSLPQDLPKQQTTLFSSSTEPSLASKAFSLFLASSTSGSPFWLVLLFRLILECWVSCLALFWALLEYDSQVFSQGSWPSVLSCILGWEGEGAKAVAKYSTQLGSSMSSSNRFLSAFLQASVSVRPQPVALAMGSIQVASKHLQLISFLCLWQLSRQLATKSRKRRISWASSRVCSTDLADMQLFVSGFI